MKIYLVVTHDAGWSVEAKVFPSKEQAEKWLYEWLKEALGVDELSDIDPEMVQYIEEKGVPYIYEEKFLWGENDSPCVMFFEIDVEKRSCNVLIPR